MRAIGHVENEKMAFRLYSYLLQIGIHSSYEWEGDHVVIWIYEEDELDRASEILTFFKENPDSPEFANIPFPEAPPQPPDRIAEPTPEAPKPQAPKPQAPKRRKHPLTSFVILLCVFLYVWNMGQFWKVYKADGKEAAQLVMTPVQQLLMFDYPLVNQEINKLIKEKTPLTQAKKIPVWKGVLSEMLYAYKKKPDPNEGASLFTKIREGQVWRLFTPALLHGGLLHILFNMLWAWLLLRQVEERLSTFKVILLILLIGIVANVAQYIVSGPYFLGFSGVVCGLVGFIWVRQKVAPWEGYPLNRSTIIFILIFVGAMFVLELFSLFTALFTAKEISANIANTAHIIGGLFGALLARVPFFSRGMR